MSPALVLLQSVAPGRPYIFFVYRFIPALLCAVFLLAAFASEAPILWFDQGEVVSDVILDVAALLGASLALLPELFKRFRGLFMGLVVVAAGGRAASFFTQIFIGSSLFGPGSLAIASITWATIAVLGVLWGITIQRVSALIDIANMTEHSDDRTSSSARS